MKPIVLPATLDACIIKKDKSASVRFTTELELRPHENDWFFENHGQTGILYFRAGDKVQSEIDSLDEIDVDLEDKSKTPSKRLRNVLFKVWEAGSYQVDFKEFYRREMERIIEHYKSKLDEN